MLVCNVVGARPNFMKIAPVVQELDRRGLPQFLVHTGQHYDPNMSQIFFEELGMPEPDIFLNVGSDTHARQTAKIMVAFEEVCRQRQPDLVVVGGDVNSTLAASLVAAKLQIPIAHVESGLRSYDRAMPEEINRILTDHLSELLYTTEVSANDNLRNEGIDAAKVHFVGNCMVDTLMRHLHAAVSRAPWQALRLEPKSYAVVTLHRPENVDHYQTMETLMAVLKEVSRSLPIIFPVHPRTRNSLKKWNISQAPMVHLLEPLPYFTFIGLMAKARLVLTDSGGIQEETTILGIPCLTLRQNTERPVTITAGTNRLVGQDRDQILQGIQEILAGKWPVGRVPPLWDGRARLRIVDTIASWAARR